MVLICCRWYAQLAMAEKLKHQSYSNLARNAAGQRLHIRSLLCTVYCKAWIRAWWAYKPHTSVIVAAALRHLHIVQVRHLEALAPQPAPKHPLFGHIHHH